MIRVILNGRERDNIGISRDLHQALCIIDDLRRWSIWVGDHDIV